MPKYDVVTDQGTFEITLDRPPASPEELRSLAEEALSGPSQATRTAPEPGRPSAFQAAVEPFRRVGAGLIEMPFSIGRGLAQIPQIDWLDVLRHPGQLVEAGTETGKALAPAILPTAGAIIGSAVGPAGTVAGGVGGEFLNQAIKQLWTGQPETPLEVLTSGATMGVGTLAGAATPQGLRQAARATGRGAFQELPGARQLLERTGVTPTLADVTGSKTSGILENIAGNAPTSAGIIQRAQDVQRGEALGAFERAMTEAGGVGSRARIGQAAREGATGRFQQLEGIANRMRGEISKMVGPEDAIPTTNLRAEATRLAKEMREIKYPDAPTLQLIGRLEKISAGYQPAPVAGGAPSVAAAPKLPDPVTVSDAVSRLVGRGVQPAQAGRRALEDLLRDGFAEEASIAAVNRSLKEATGRTAAPLTEETIQATRQAVAGRPALAPVAEKPGVGPKTMTLDQWYATQTNLGQAGRDVNLLTTQERAINQRLWGAMQKDLETWNPAHPEVRASVTRFKEFYKNNIVPFNRSLPGRLAAGKINPEDAAQLFTKDGLTELQQVKRYLPEQFQDVRQVWLGGLFEKAGVTHPERGFQGGNFARAWRSIDGEVKARAFTKDQIAAFDDLATVADRLGKKLTTPGGGSPSGTPAGVVGVGQLAAIGGGMGKAGWALASGEPLTAAASLGTVLGVSLGPVGLAKLLTTEGGIRYLTRALQIPAGSREAMAVLGQIAAARRLTPQPEAERRPVIRGGEPSP